MITHGSRRCASPRFVRFIIGSTTTIFTVAATTTYWVVVVGDAGVNLAEAISVPLFSCLFGWSTFSFFVAIFGWNAWRKKLDDVDAAESVGVSDSRIGERTAVLMPIYNENPMRVFAGVLAMVQSLRLQGKETEFDFYILSDTTQSETWLEEEAQWAKLTADLGKGCRVFYRHRPQNTARKSGNIADFCTRWGANYQYMIVLDADSLVAGETMVEMVRRMEADKKIGILQVPPLPIGRSSLFARMQQFGAQLYGPVFCEGFTRWAGDEGNYWGHNAIIRIQPFMQNCDLPILPGSAPLGGEIMSHDFVEAALMLRSGWKVQLATDLGGSFEECPTTLADYAQRDQRWCQGNLQHCRFIVAERFKSLSRWHFLSGIMSYVSAPLLILFTLFCVMGVAYDASLVGAEFTERERLPAALLLFCVSMCLLLMPKFITVLVLLFHSNQASKFGGRGRLICSAVIECVLSMMLSPVMAIFHTRFVIAAIRGKSVRWSAQQRDESGVRWSDSFRQFLPMTLIGLILAGIVSYAFTPLLIWFAPMIAGLVLSIPMGVALGSVPLGNRLRRFGLLTISEERSPSIIKKLHQQALLRIIHSQPDRPKTSRFQQVIRDPEFYSLHASIQRSSDAGVTMSADQIAAIEVVRRDKGMTAIPDSLRKAVLLDASVLRRLHVAEQCKSDH